MAATACPENNDRPSPAHSVPLPKNTAPTALKTLTKTLEKRPEKLNIKKKHPKG